jgi:hypothetical protein
VVLNTSKPIYVVDHYKMAGGKLEGGDSLTFNAENDSDAWQKANEWSASSSWVLFQATHQLEDDVLAWEVRLGDDGDDEVAENECGNGEDNGVG